MRFARWVAFAAWVVVALLAVAGFAAFSPRPTPTPTTTTEARSASSDWGSISGRVVAYAFGSGLRALPAGEPLVDDHLLKELMAARTPKTELEAAGSAPVTEPQVGSSAPMASPATPTGESEASDILTATTITTTPPSGELSEDEARAILSLFFAPEDVDRALDVAHCESRWNPAARNPVSGASGFFQQLPRFWAERSAAAGWEGADIFEAHANAAVSAWLVYEGGGWDHWAASRACWS